MEAAKLSSGSKSRLALAGWLALCFAVAALSGAFTAKAITTWYAALAKPSFNPPNWIFGPVWTVLYAMMAVAAWLAWKEKTSPMRTRALAWFCVQLALNFFWSLIFFYRQRIFYALVDILLLWVAILVTTVFFFRIRRLAGWLMVPYLAWVSFASVLNWAILMLAAGS